VDSYVLLDVIHRPRCLNPLRPVANQCADSMAMGFCPNEKI